MKNKHKYPFIIIFLLSVFVNSYSQKINYYWAQGKKVEVKEDITTSIIFTKPNTNLAIKKGGVIREVKNFRKQRFGEYSIIKYSDSKFRSTAFIDDNRIRCKSNGFVSNNDTIYTTNNIVLRFKTGMSIDDIYHIVEKYKLKYINARYDNVVLEIENIDLVFDAANEIYLSGKVEWSQPDFLSQIKTCTLTGNMEQYYLRNYYHVYTNQISNDIKAEPAWDISKGCPNIKVAIIDEGVNDHPDLMNPIDNTSRVLDGLSIDASSVNGRCVPGYYYSHGTKVAGVIAASHSTEIKGIAPNVSIVPINIGDAYDYISSSDMAYAINWAADSEGGDADVITLALERNDITGNFDVLLDAISNATANGRDGLGAIVVYAAGNSNNDNSYVTSQAFVVAAIDMFDNKAHYSNFGENIDLVAYGGNPNESVERIRTIGTIEPDGTGRYHFFNGTSAACAQVSGAAALVLSVNPNLTRIELEDILKSTAVDIGAPGFDNIFGNGKLNVLEAVKKSASTLGLNFYYDMGYLSTRTPEMPGNFNFTASPGSGVSPGAYKGYYHWCVKEIPISKYEDFFCYLGDGLVSEHYITTYYTGDGYCQLKATKNVTTQKYELLTFLLRLDTSPIKKTVPQDVNIVNSPKWCLSYITRPDADVVSSSYVTNGMYGIYNKGNIYATNSITLKPGFSVPAGSTFLAGISATPDQIVCSSDRSARVRDLEIENVSDSLSYKQSSGFAVDIYPNPSSGNFTVQIFDELNPNAFIKIFNLNGTLVYEEKMNSNRQDVMLLVEKGVYVILVQNGDESFENKLIIE